MKEETTFKDLVDHALENIPEKIHGTESMKELVKRTKEQIAKNVEDFTSFLLKSKVNIVILGENETTNQQFIQELSVQIPTHHRISLIDNTPELQHHKSMSNHDCLAFSCGAEYQGKILEEEDFFLTNHKLRPDHTILPRIKDSKLKTFIELGNRGDLTPGFITTMKSIDINEVLRKFIDAMDFLEHHPQKEDLIKKSLASMFNIIFIVHPGEQQEPVIMEISECKYTDGQLAQSPLFKRSNIASPLSCVVNSGLSAHLAHRIMEISSVEKEELKQWTI